jgi:peptidoglycan/LPS O-acetylase OafA/YrhL
MKKRLSFPIVVTLALLVVALIATIGYWLMSKFNLPDWTNVFVSSLIYLAYFEIVGQLGPKPFNTLLTEYSKMTVRDKGVILSASLAFIVIVFLVGTSYESRWIRLVFMCIGILVFMALCLIFGSVELKTRLRFKRKNEETK